MEDTELKQRLGLIVEHEQRTDVDWAIIERLCDVLAEDVGIEAPLIVQEYLASFDRRRSDSVFGHAQRSELLRYLRDG